LKPRLRKIVIGTDVEEPDAIAAELGIKQPAGHSCRAEVIGRLPQFVEAGRAPVAAE
jgi:hypothetical protein